MSNQKNKKKHEIREIKDFENMNLDELLLRGIYEYKFEIPSPIQQKSILPIAKGFDIVAQSQSGTGKTGAFLIGILQKISILQKKMEAEKEHLHGCQAIIVSPTWELATQSANVCKALSKYMNINIILCIGGTDIYISKRLLSKGASIVIGTPGRIVDMILKRKFLSTSTVRALILDEADELLQYNFLEQIKAIVSSILENTQICLFSATMPPPVIDITKNFMTNPIMILIKKEKLTLEGIKQYYVDVGKNQWKFDTLCDLYELISINQSIIYVNSKNSAKWLSRELAAKNFTVSTIYGGMDKNERMKVMENFRLGEARVLVSTDLLARGIDVRKVAIVINFDIPQNKETYLHRIGRSGRYGKHGTAINFVTRYDIYILKNIERFYRTNILPMPNPENLFH